MQLNQTKFQNATNNDDDTNDDYDGNYEILHIHRRK